MQDESKYPLSGATVGFFQKISAKLVKNTVEDFTKIIMFMEIRNQDKWNANMLVDYSWTLQKDVPDTKYR